MVESSERSPLTEFQKRWGEVS